MKPQYITLPDTTPRIIGLDTYGETFNVTVRASAGVTVELTIEEPNDAVGTGGNPPTGPAPTFVASPAAASNGVIQITAPCRALRLTAAASGTVTILQQGN